MPVLHAPPRAQADVREICVAAQVPGASYKYRFIAEKIDSICSEPASALMWIWTFTSSGKASGTGVRDGLRPPAPPVGLLTRPAPAEAGAVSPFCVSARRRLG